MRFPLMLRSTHDALMEERSVAMASEGAISEYWRGEAMRLSGVVATLVDRMVPPKPAPVERPPDPIAAAIRQRSAGNSALRGHLAHFARAERERGTPQDEIVKQISDWSYRPTPPGEPTAREREEANETVANILDG
jgi:hypothetical protein